MRGQCAQESLIFLLDTKPRFKVTAAIFVSWVWRARQPRLESMARALGLKALLPLTRAGAALDARGTQVPVPQLHEAEHGEVEARLVHVAEEVLGACEPGEALRT